jgi:hypothetical protein
MSIDAEFDMISPLSNEAVDWQNWQNWQLFIKIIKERYQNDNLVEIKTNYIVFKTGEHPLLPTIILAPQLKDFKVVLSKRSPCIDTWTSLGLKQTWI